MARSEYIYVVLGWTIGKIPVASFTVKHELVTWLRRRPDKDGLKIWRMRDGGEGKRTELTIRELLGKEVTWHE